MISRDAPTTAPTVSVLLVSYNHARFVGAAIASILAQTYTDFELIIADDASTDGSQEIIRSFNDPRIRVLLRERNLGVVHNFNDALAQAKGQYIAQLGSDDIFLPDKLARQVEVLQSQPDVACVFTHVEIIGKDGMPYRHHPLRHFKHLFNQPNRSREEWLKTLFINNCLAAPTALMRRSAIERTGGYDPRYLAYQDYDWWIRFCLAGYQLHVIPEILTWYRRLPNGKSLSSKTMNVYNRGRFEQRHLLKQYAAMSLQDYCRVFGRDDKGRTPSLLPYYLAREALEIGSRTHREAALEWLFDLLGDDVLAQQLETAHNFGVKDYYRLTERNALGYPLSVKEWIGLAVLPLLSIPLHDLACKWIYRRKSILPFLQRMT